VLPRAQLREEAAVYWNVGRMFEAVNEGSMRRALEKEGASGRFLEEALALRLWKRAETESSVGFYDISEEPTEARGFLCFMAYGERWNPYLERKVPGTEPKIEVGKRVRTRGGVSSSQLAGSIVQEGGRWVIRKRAEPEPTNEPEKRE
jgi:hypothetical protein